LVEFFQARFDPVRRHDAFILLIDIVHNVIKETLPKDLLKNIFEAKNVKNSDMITYHETGIFSQQFGILTGTLHTCEKNHERKIL
jgi:hypothetical protein